MLTDLLQQFHLHQLSHFATHIHRKILDLVLDSGRYDLAVWTLSPYSDHFVIFIQVHYLLNRYYLS